MDLRLQKPAFWASLHLRRGLHDWDLAGELSLGATCDQGPQVESTMQPHLWTWVNPSLVCPIPGPVLFPPAGQEAPPAAHLLCLQEEQLCSSLASQAEERGGEAPQPVLADLPQAEDAQRGQTPASRKVKTLRSRGRKLKRVQGGWARPPLNYCILISLALSSSADGSLTVQEIYQFTRQHFPFFRTAPEGWKNTVRHNLCFSSSFEKTTDFVCLEGNRKSRLWKLTSEGRRKFQEETQVLTEEVMGLVHQSMDRPELMSSLFGL
ncbi:forkhead box protein R1 isoform X2 [Pogona vitticeps]